MERDNGIWLLLIYLFLSIYVLPMYPHGGSANELTRWATAASLVEKGSFDISWTEPLIGPNVDTARIGDKVYSNKAPAPAILAAPAYALTRVFIGPPNASNIRISWFAIRFFLSTLPVLLLGVWLYARETDELSLATFLFATPIFLYSLLLFSHVFAALVLYFAFRIIYDQRYVLPWHCLVAGALCGLAVLSEFPTIFPAAVFGIGLYFVDKRERLRRPMFFILGGMPFALFLGFYNLELFGSPFSMSYAHESFPEWAEVAGQGVFGLGWPSPYNFYLLLFSPSRGLFFVAPILLFSILTFFTSREVRTVRHHVKVAAIAVTVIAMCGHSAAHGGWAFGPRYLILIIPLFLDSLFDSEAYEFSNFWQGIFFGLSLTFCVIPVLTFPFAPPEFTHPVRDYWMKFLVSEHWYVPNLANVLGAQSSIWTIVPVFAALILAAYLVALGMRRRRRFFLGMMVACGLAGLYIYAPLISADTENAFRRATIAERYFRPADRLDSYKAQAAAGGDLPAISRIRQFEWLIADARGYAPNDFPYLPANELVPGPTQLLKSAAVAQSNGDTIKAAAVLESGKQQFEFARCDLSTNLAVIYYTSWQRDKALQELEAVQPLVDRTSSSGCVKSQFLLGNIYRDLDRSSDASRAFAAFLANSEGTTDQELINFRKQLGK